MDTTRLAGTDMQPPQQNTAELPRDNAEDAMQTALVVDRSCPTQPSTIVSDRRGIDSVR